MIDNKLENYSIIKIYSIISYLKQSS